MQRGLGSWVEQEAISVRSRLVPAVRSDDEERSETVL